MKTQNVHAKEAAAKAKFLITNHKPDELAVQTQHVVALIRRSPLYADPILSQAVVQWDAAAVAIEQRDQAIKTGMLTLAGLRAQRAKDVTVWKRSTKAMLAAVDTVSAGSGQVITQLGFALDTRQAAPPSTDPPLGLRAKYNKSFVLVVRWKAIKGSRAYQLQIGDAAGQTFGASIACMKAKYEPQGLVPGQKVTLRVAVQRKDGLSGWSEAVTVSVR